MIIFLFLALQLEDVQEFFKPVIQQASSFEVMFKKCESSQCRGLQAPYRGLKAPCVIVSLYYHTNDVCWAVHITCLNVGNVPSWYNAI